MHSILNIIHIVVYYQILVLYQNLHDFTLQHVMMADTAMTVVESVTVQFRCLTVMLQ